MNRALFLDRDGVLNKEIGDYAFTKDNFIINTTSIPFLQHAIKQGYLLIVISNQGGIGKGLYMREDAEKMHQIMKEEFERHGIYFAEIYYCPHHPSTSRCLCRKPETILIEKAAARFNINISQSYFIGDHDRDMEAARRSGLKPIHIIANEDISKYINIIS